MKLTAIQNDQITTNDTINTDLTLERDSLRQEMELFKTALDEWSKRYEEIRLQNEQIAKYYLSSYILLIYICFPLGN